DDDRDLRHALGDSGISGSWRGYPGFHLPPLRASHWRDGAGASARVHHASAGTDLVRRGPAGGYRLPDAGDHREDLQRDLAGAQATSWNVQFPALLGDPQPRTTVTRCRVRRQYLYRLALAGFRTGCRGWRQDTAGLRSAAVEHRRLHAALCGGPQYPCAVASRAAWRSVRRHSVRDRQGAVWPLRTPLPRLPPD